MPREVRTDSRLIPVGTRAEKLWLAPLVLGLAFLAAGFVAVLAVAS